MAASLQNSLTNAASCAGLQTSPVVKLWSHNLTSVLATAISEGSTSPASGAMLSAAAIDSSQSELGPIIADRARTIGKGKININAIAQDFHLSEYDGTDLHNLTGPGLIVLRTNGRAAATRQVSPPRIVASQLRYDVDVHAAVVAPSVSYGLTDRCDLSLLIPIIHINGSVNAANQLVQEQGASGFEPIPGKQPTTVSRQVVNDTGLGDITLRGKYELKPLEITDELVLRSAVMLGMQFPSGDEDAGFGTGDYWLYPQIVALLPVWENRLEFNAGLGVEIDLIHVNESLADYSAGLSFRIIPRRLAGVVEFLGQSELGTDVFRLDTGALYLLPGGTLDRRSFMGMEFGRRDFFNLAFGLRLQLPYGFVAFAAGVFPLNTSGMTNEFVVPTFGIGANF